MKERIQTIPEEWQVLLMKALDEALSEEEQERFEHLLASSVSFRSEWDALIRVRHLTRKVSLKPPRKEVWDMYQTNIYNRLERGISWLLFLAGVIMLTGYGIYHFFAVFLIDDNIPLTVRIGATLAGSGLAALLLSVIREKFNIWKKDPYRKVER